ncbi:MAG: porin family protein [Bacteroidales bacterium]
MNRNIFLGFTTILIVASILNIRPVKAQKFEGGVMAGLCASQVAGDTYSGYNKAGIFAGTYVALHLNDRIALRLELDYIQKGSSKNANSDSLNYDSYKISLGYVEMPFLFQLKYGKKIIAEAGPAMSFLIHSSEKINTVKIDGAIPFKKQNLSIIAGVTYLLNERVSVGLRTNNSLNSIRVNNKVKDYRKRFGTYGQFNDVLVINLSYKL